MEISIPGCSTPITRLSISNLAQSCIMHLAKSLLETSKTQSLCLRIVKLEDLQRFRVSFLTFSNMIEAFSPTVSWLTFCGYVHKQWRLDRCSICALIACNKKKLLPYSQRLEPLYPRQFYCGQNAIHDGPASHIHLPHRHKLGPISFGTRCLCYATDAHVSGVSCKSFSLIEIR